MFDFKCGKFLNFDPIINFVANLYRLSNTSVEQHWVTLLPIHNCKILFDEKGDMKDEIRQLHEKLFSTRTHTSL